LEIKIVIPASGAGVRLGGDIPKQFLQLGGEPILKRTLSIFSRMKIVSEIAVAVPEGYAEEVRDYDIPKLTHIVTGEKTRAESVYAALKCFNADYMHSRQNKHLEASDYIALIHDGIRPFVTPEIIEAVAKAAKEHGAAVACAPVTDTIKQVSQGIITSTPNRKTLWQAQTPQGFTYETILQAYAAAEENGYLSEATDDSALAERIGTKVHIVPSSPANIKITTPTDLLIARALLENL